MPPIEIVKRIDLQEDNWHHISNTNCYAFAIGLDIPEIIIADNAYQIGTLASLIEGFSPDDLKKLSYEERFLLDMNALNIKVTEEKISSLSYMETIKNYCFLSWVISLYQRVNDFHFIRKAYNGSWYHKRGYALAPSPLLTEPTEANQEVIKAYNHVKTYRLTCQFKN